MTFPKKASDFSITASYDNGSSEFVNPGHNKVIAKFTVVIPPALVSDSPKDVRVTFNLDKHGILGVQGAQLLEEYTVEEPVTPAEEAKPEDEKTADEKPAATTVLKKKLRKIDLTVNVDTLTLSRDDIKAAIEIEARMALEDKLIKETADKRNELESYIYGMRDKIDASLKAYSTADESQKLKSMLVEAEDWLYGDGFDEVKSAYVKRIDELRAVGNVIESRYVEETNRPQAINALKTQIELCKAFAANYDEAHSHIEEEERNRIRAEASEAESWLFDTQAKQGELSQNKDPILTTDEISKKRTKLFNVANPIMIKPKPKPVPKEEPKKEEPKPEEGKASEEKEGKNGSVPMDE
jgi:heat shock protein 4